MSTRAYLPCAPVGVPSARGAWPHRPSRDRALQASLYVTHIRRGFVMTKLGFGALALAALISCVALSSSAQARWAPSGSYEDSCTNVRFDGDTLTASCRRHNGTWKNTWLPNADNCDGNIVNDNGQ